MNYLDYDYLITTDNIKKNLLLEASLNKSFLSTKIITLNELKNILFGSVKKNALKYVMDYYNVLPGVAQTYLKNQEYIEELHNYLDENNLITYNKVKLENKKILLLDVFVEKYVLDRLNNYDIDINNVDNKKLDVFEFDSLYDELVYIAVSIKRLLKTIDINNIKLVNVSNDIVFLLKQVFSLFSLPLEDLDNNALISHDEVKTFLDNINKLDLESNLNIIKDKDIKEKIINLINDYDLSNLDSKDIDILKYLFNKTNCKKKKYKNVVECINYEDILDDDKYYFVIGFNEGIILKNYKDDDYLSDDEKKKIGLFTSYEKNENEKLLLLKKIFSSNNINLSYHLNSFYESGILPSSIVKEYDFNVIKNVSIDNTYSYKYNVIKYASLLDQFYKYNV